MMGRTAFIYTEKYFQFDYGPHHPLRMERLKLAHDLIEAYGLLNMPNLIIREPAPADPVQLETFHRPEYLDVLRQCSADHHNHEIAEAYGLGPGDNPVFSGMWELSLLTCGASLMSARMAADGEAAVVFNMAGGMHHASPRRAAGFCYVNDAVVAIQDLLKRGLRVAYVDIDAHHGDGVQDAFYDTDRVLTISIHQHGRTLFPGTGFVYDTGVGRGRGYSVNMPVFPGTDDEVFGQVFESLVPDLLRAFRPDILITQLGVDTLHTDPLTNLSLTTNGFVQAVRRFKELDVPWVALGGGGYHLVNVARAWTLAWAIMNDVEPPDALPDSFIQTIRRHGYREERLRDAPLQSKGELRREAESVAKQVIDSIRQTVLPVISDSSGRTSGGSSR